MPDSAAAFHSRPSTKLGDILMYEKPTPSYADFHHQITRNVDSYLPDSSGSQQLDRREGKTKEDELVRYMSTLPSYLERGKGLQGKPLSVGVLDWRRLEKWNCNNNLMSLPHNKNGYDSSVCSTSYFTAEGSSSHLSRIRSSSSVQQREHHPSLQYHLEASPMKTNTQEKFYSRRNRSDTPTRQRSCHLVPHSHHQKVYPWEGRSQHVVPIIGNVKKFSEMPASISKHGIRQQNPCGMDQILGRNQSMVREEFDEKKEIGGKLKIRESELKEAMKSRTSDLGNCHSDSSQELNRVVLLVPRDAMNGGIANLPDSVASANLMPMDCAKKSLSEQDSLEGVRSSGVSSSVSYSRSLHVQEDSKTMIVPCSRIVLGSKLSSQQPSGSSISGNAEEKKPIVVLKSSYTTHPSGEVGNRYRSQSTAKLRHPSPIHRLGSAMGSIIRSAGSIDNSPLRRSSSKDAVSKPCFERAAVSTSSNNGKPKASSRTRSSPLRRLLDPIIKPKPPVVRQLVETPRKDAASTAGPCKLSDERVDLLNAKTSSGVKTNGVKNIHRNMKKGSCQLQALLQVAVKNGLPLFTFSVDNDSDILAASLGNSSAACKDHSSWIYTFFTVHRMKKKSALWLNQGSKCNGHYVPIVVAQMKVSDHQVPIRIRQKGMNGNDVREFALFSVDVGQADEHCTEFQPANELGAIVVKLKATTPQDRQSIRSQIPMSTTLILPGDVHTIPSKGSISTLMQRWKSGGSCDCGGWDVGCQLRTFTNQGDSQIRLTSSKTDEVPDEFKLFSQAGQESQLILSLTPFKDRVYSVEFDSSLSLLQAFSTCVAVLDCRRPSGLFGTNNMKEARSSRSSVAGDPAQTKAPNQRYGEAPASYVSYPPHSPVGRV